MFFKKILIDFIHYTALLHKQSLLPYAGEILEKHTHRKQKRTKHESENKWMNSKRESETIFQSGS